MPGARKPGMDHSLYDWSALPGRPPLRWPDGARVALCVVVNLEHYELEPPEGAFMPATLPGGVGRMPFPDLCNFSHREYGNRVGVFRVMRVLDKYGIRATAAIDAAVAENYPYIVEQGKRRGWEFIGHGLAITQAITSNMSEDDERGYIRRSLDAVASAAGSRPVGWFGPEFGESSRTLGLLREEGIRYVCDWPNDEQPYPMTGEAQGLYSLPLLIDLDDVMASWTRSMAMNVWSGLVKEAFNGLYRDGAGSGRVLVLSLHPWFIGQPFRIKYLDQALAHITKRTKLWKATGREVVEWCAANQDAPNAG